jgi:hypothetical protein
MKGDSPILPVQTKLFDAPYEEPAQIKKFRKQMHFKFEVEEAKNNHS